MFKQYKIVTSFLLLFTSSLFAQQQIDFTDANDGNTYELVNCNGFIIDAGGQGGGGYNNNQNTTITICPPSGSNEIINVQFPLFDLNDPAGPNNGDFMEVFDGPDINAPSLGVYTNNDLQGNVVQASNLNASGCLTFRFTSDATITGSFAGNASCTAPCENPTAAATILNAPAPDSIAVCVGEQVDFADNGSFAVAPYNIDSYTWDFMDGTTANGANVSHTYSFPGQYIVNLTVDDDNTDSDPCTNLNVTELIVYVSTYPTFNPFPFDTVLCIGEEVTLATDPFQYDSTWYGFPSSNTTDDGCLSDNMIGVPQSIALQMNGFTSGSVINNINDIQSICLDIEHSFMGDIVVQVQCPNGQTVTLHQQGGGGTYLGVPIDDGTEIQCNPPANQGTPWSYCFTPTATDTWVDWVNNQGGFGLTLPAGDYASVTPLNGLIGCPANGQWNIIVTDNWGIDDGNITAFSVNLNPSFYPTSNQFTPHIGSNIDSSSWVGPLGPEVSNQTPDGNSITVTPTAAGNYQYTYSVTNNFGCSFDSTVTVVVEQGPIADAGPDLSGCIGDQVQLEGSIGGGNSSCTYTLQLDDTWGDSWNGNSINITINGVTTNYSVNNGAQFIANLNVSHGDQIDIQYDDGGSWDYENEIRIYDSNGNLVYSDGLNGATPTTTIQNIIADCYGNVVFEWTPPAGLSDPSIPNPDHTVAGNQTYTLSTYPVGHPACASTDDMNVTLNVLEYAGEDSTTVMCTTTPPMDLFDFVAGTPGNIPDVGGDWTDDNGNPVIMPFDPATMPAGDYTYTVGAGTGCPDFSVITIQYTQLNITVDIVDSECGSNNGSLEAHVTDGFTPYQFTIDGGANYQTDSLFSNLQGGQAYTIDVVDDKNCLATIQGTVNTTNIPAINNTVVVDASCNTLCDGEVTVTATNAVEYEIVGLINSQPNNIMNGLCAGNYDVVIHNGSCSDTTQITINEPTAVVVQSISNDTSICPGDPVTLTAQGGAGAVNGYTYNWTLNGVSVGTTQTITVTPANGATSVYCVEIGENCASPTVTSCVTVDADPRIAPKLIANNLNGCAPVIATFNNLTNDPNNAVTSYEWVFGDGNSDITATNSTTIHTYKTSGIYDVSLIITTQNGCVFDSTYSSYIEVFSNPMAGISSQNNPATMFEPVIDFISTSTGNNLLYEWTFEQGNPHYAFTESQTVAYPEGEEGNYEVKLKVIDINGCTDSIYETARIISDILFFAPNAFTPDGDIHNETWRVYIEGIDIYKFNLKIFNRWGEIMWESNNPDASWDGTYKATGEKVPDGVYVWRVEYSDIITDKRYENMGHVTIIK